MRLMLRRMSTRILIVLVLALIGAVSAAIATVAFGGGVIWAFLAYSLVGAVLTIVFAGLAVLLDPFRGRFPRSPRRKSVIAL